MMDKIKNYFRSQKEENTPFLNNCTEMKDLSNKEMMSSMEDSPILHEIDIADSANCEEYSKVVNTYSIRGNRYVKVKEIDKVYTPGNYVVGMDIDCGEYYFWGDCIYAEIKGKRAHCITGAFGTCFDAYSQLYEKNKVILESGFMTKIDNIDYTYTQSDDLIPRHIYRVGAEIPQGRYKYMYDKQYDYNEVESFLGVRECAFDRYKDEHGDRIYRVNGNSGYAETDSLTKYIVIIKGRALLEEAGNFHPNSGPEHEAAMLKEYERRKKVEQIKSEKLSDTSKVFDGEYIYYYFAVIDPIAEIVTKNYISRYGEVELLKNLTEEDFSHNYRVRLRLEDVDRQCVIYYMFMEHKIQAPACCGVCLADIFPMYKKGKTNDDNLNKAISVLKRTTSKDVEKVLKQYEKIYPYHALDSSYYYVKYVPKKMYFKYTKEDDNSYFMYYYMRDHGRSGTYEKMYSSIVLELAEKGLVSKKWKSEFSLYMLAKSYFPDVVYQFRAEWLQGQSLDIFIPEINIGIEYQGIQHYEAVDVFGGDKGLESVQQRDDQKRKKCQENGVTLIEWNYTLDISDINFQHMLSKYNIPIPPKQHIDYVLPQDVEKHIIKKCAIYQYGLDGGFIAEYDNVSDAAEKCNINEYNIQRACRGFRSTAGGYQWRKVELPNAKDRISPVDKKTVNGAKRRVIQLNLEDDVMATFDSISEAVKITGINSKSIRDAATGKQNHAGGYRWKYDDEK